MSVPRFQYATFCSRAPEWSQLVLSLLHKSLFGRYCTQLEVFLITPFVPIEISIEVNVWGTGTADTMSSQSQAWNKSGFGDVSYCFFQYVWLSRLIQRWCGCTDNICSTIIEHQMMNWSNDELINDRCNTIACHAVAFQIWSHDIQIKIKLLYHTASRVNSYSSTEIICVQYRFLLFPKINRINKLRYEINIILQDQLESISSS